LVRRSDELTAIPERGGRFDGQEIGHGSDRKHDDSKTNVYYESLTLGDETREAGVFIDGAEGLLIWEIAYDKTVSYSVKPYAYVGVMNVEQLIAPDGNTKTYGTEKANFNAFSVVFKNEDGSTVATETKNYGQTVSAPQETPEKAGYTFDAWYNGATAYDFTKPVTGALELTAKFNANTDTAYTVKVYKEKLLGGGYDLVETVNAKGTTDDTVSIEDVTVTADTTGMSVNATKSVQEGVVNANGSLELSVYYDYPKYGVNKKAWNLNYDANKNYIYVSTKNQDSTALEFASNAQKVYFAGKMNMNSGFGNYGFTVTSGTTQRWVMMSNDTIGKFMVRGCNYTGSGFSASDAGFTDVNHNGISSANVMTGYSMHRFEVGKTYRIQTGRVGNRLFIFIDGELAVECTDPDPLPYGKFGFGVYASKAQFRNLKVYRPFAQEFKTSYQELKKNK
ncbi:MAG: InlB B-repeat-containing protein, partial [Clostridia bacterium]|nr:InlB B-repeat-containing protein [Clostridia bacterium]